MVRGQATSANRLGFKAALFALLAANTVYFVVFGTASKAIDATAWLTLLVLFEAEAGFGDRPITVRRRMAVRWARLVAAAGVFAATIGYVFEDNALDAVNSVLWILLVILLEVELRWPALVARNRRAFKAAAFGIFGGLGVLVALWAAAGMWIDAYDAVLWLVAYATIEQDITKRG